MPNILGFRIGKKKRNTERNRAKAIGEARELLNQYPNARKSDLTDVLAARRRGETGTFRGIPLKALERRKRRG